MFTDDIENGREHYVFLKTPLSARSPGSDPDGLAIAEDGSPGNSYHEDAKRQPHSETSRHRLVSRFDVCEVFSPARVSVAAGKRGLRGGWSLDLSQPCKVTGRTWNCLEDFDRAWDDPP